MSTNTKKKHGTGAAVVLIVLCLLALGTPGALKAQTGQEKFEDAFIAIVRGASK